MASQESPTSFHPDVASGAAFDAEAMKKLDVVSTDRLLLGLNCFEPGQTQRVHEHGAADKFYLVLSGKASVTIGTQTRELRAGDLAFAPAGVPHGVARAHERTVMLVGITR